jgi:hypothetical protein
MQVIENLLSKHYENDIENTLNDINFPWYFYDEISKGDYNNPAVTESFGLVHTIYDSYNGVNSNYYPFFKSILYFMEDKFNIEFNRILRIRIRKTTPIIGHNLNKYNRPHVDLPEASPYKTLVYYVNDSDGDTVLFNEFYTLGESTEITKEISEYKRNTPKKGSAILFDGHRIHAGNNPVNYKQRIVINFDFLEK